MQHFRRRCKHCGKVYTYCTYGNGPKYGTQEGCSMDYCADCQNAIDDALGKIPRRYEVKYTLLDDSNDKGISKTRIELNKIFDEEKEKYESIPNLINVVQMIPNWNYESVERCFIDCVEYFRCTKEDGSTDFRIGMEYDVIDNKFTGNKYFDNKNPYRRYAPVAQVRWSKINTEIKPKPLPLPKGDLSYMTLNLNVETNDKDD